MKWHVVYGTLSDLFNQVFIEKGEMGKKTRQQSKIQSRSSIYLDISFITGYAEHNDVESWSKTVSFGHVSKGVW